MTDNTKGVLALICFAFTFGLLTGQCLPGTARDLPPIQIVKQGEMMTSQQERELIYHVEELERKVSGIQGQINKLNALVSRK